MNNKILCVHIFMKRATHAYDLTFYPKLCRWQLEW